MKIIWNFRFYETYYLKNETGWAIGGVDGANKEFAEVCKGLRFFECLMLARMVREKIDFTELKMV